MLDGECGTGIGRTDGQDAKRIGLTHVVVNSPQTGLLRLICAFGCRRHCDRPHVSSQDG